MRTGWGRPPIDAIAARADEFDAAGVFPAEAIRALTDEGLLAAPVPLSLGGSGLGTEAHAAELATRTFVRLGAAWLPLARVFEGHVNALRLILRYGTAAQGRAACDDARGGALFAIWAAEAQPVTWQAGRASGRKSFASGASVVTRPLITARTEGGETMALLRLPDAHAAIGDRRALLGMRGAGTAEMVLDGVPAEPVGKAGDYMRQPEISLGAWRALAGLAGGLQALTQAIGVRLRARGQQRDTLQAARFGQMLVARDTALLWVERAGTLAEAEDAGEPAAAFVKLTRHAVDRAAGEMLELARRAAGFASVVAPDPIERLCRDIETYRRQPALDEVLLEAAAHVLET